MFDPADFGAAVLGSKPTWAVQPKSMWRDGDGVFPYVGYTQGWKPSWQAPAGMTFDETTNRLYLRWSFYSFDYPCMDRIFVYSVNC